MNTETAGGTWPQARIALCHDWLSGMRGGERVLEILCEAYPEAPLYTLLAKPSAVSEPIRNRAIHTSWLQRIPNIASHYRMFLPLFPAAVHSLKPAPADVLISTSHCVAKSIRKPAHCHHICYCFTPMRYAWTFQEEYLGNAFRRALAGPVLSALRKWDAATANRVDTFIAISHHVRERIENYYQREASVIYPPVDTDRCTPGPDYGIQNYDLIVSALVPYKRLDLAIHTYNQSGYQLRIVGTGGALEKLKAMARPNIKFEGWQPDEVVLERYRNCRLLVFPGEEDFGIVPLEAQACGKPVVAFKRGGACETVLANKTGIFFEHQTTKDLANAINIARKRIWDPDAIRKHALTFSNAAFISNMQQAIQTCLEKSS
jgi:glycosyltransferase involved in cell wall biosynthesis